MGEIEDAIERADRESFTKEPPKTLKRRIGYLIKQLGSAKAVAQEIGVTADSVNRYRRGARKHPPADVAAKIDDAVRARWQPLVRKRRHRQAAATGGITVETRARFGYTAAVGSTDDGRFRRLTVHLPRSTRSACSTPATRGPATRRCAESSPRDSRKSISRTVESARWGFPTSKSTTSITWISTTEERGRGAHDDGHVSRGTIGVTNASLLSPTPGRLVWPASSARGSPRGARLHDRIGWHEGRARQS